MEYIIREDLSQKLTGNDKEELNNYLNNNYEYIYDAMRNEGYTIRFNDFMLFSEIIFENKVVGFATYKIYGSMNLTLLEVYVLPEFRGNHLFFEEIMGMILSMNSVSIQEPTRYIVEILVHYRLAEKLNDNLVATGLSFDISHNHLLKYGNPIVEGDICSCLLYDLDLCSPLYLGDISTPGACDIAYQKCLKKDNVDYECDKFRNSVNFKNYFTDFKGDFLKNHKRFEESLMEINERLSSFRNEFLSSQQYSDFSSNAVEEGIISPDEALKLDAQIQKELDEGIINNEGVLTRLSYLIMGEDLSNDKELLLENLSRPGYLCPYCYQPINLRDSYCSTCGHALSKNEYLMPDKIMSEIQSDDALVVDLRGDNLDKFIKEYSNDDNLGKYGFNLDNDENCLKLLKIYKENDEKAFIELKEKYDLPIDDIEEIGKLDSCVPMEFPMYGITYLKNFYTSTALIDLDKPINKHTLEGSAEFRVGDVPDNYTYYVYKILSGLNENSNLKEVLESQNLNSHSEYVFKLFQDNYIESKEYGEKIYGFLLRKFTVKELKQLLRKHKLKLSGNKDDLILRLIKNNLFYEFGINNFVLTSKGEFALKKTSWVNTFMTNMDYFDFDDFLNFMIENQSISNFEKLASKYLNQQLKIAYKNRDFHRLHDVHASKALLSIRWENIKKALIYELKLFIIRLNPIYLTNDDLKSYNPVEYSNIHNIVELGGYCNIYNFKKLFNKSWSELYLEKKLIPKKRCLNYLNKAMEGYDLDELSDEIRENYYEVK